VLILVLLPVPFLAASQTTEGKIIKVGDGETVTVLDSNKEQHRVRLAGIDAPEKGQPFDNASRKRLSELMGGKDVCVEFEKKDRYGRIVGKVGVTPPECPKCGKTLDAGLAQITSGMAWWFWRYAHEQSAGKTAYRVMFRSGMFQLYGKLP
jgi:endonuclease YncB( thermonuclease family)